MITKVERSTVKNPWLGHKDAFSLLMLRARRHWIACEEESRCYFCGKVGLQTYRAVSRYAPVCCARCTFGAFWLSAYKSVEI